RRTDGDGPAAVLCPAATVVSGSTGARERHVQRAARAAAHGAARRGGTPVERRCAGAPPRGAADDVSERGRDRGATGGAAGTGADRRRRGGRGGRGTGADPGGGPAGLRPGPRPRVADHVGAAGGGGPRAGGSA